MHDGGDNVLLAIFLLGEVERLFIKPTGIFIAAAFLEIGGVHIEDHFIEHLCILLQAPERDTAFFHQLIQMGVVGQIAAALVVDIHWCPGQIDIHIFVALVLALDMALGFPDACLRVLLNAGYTVVFIIHTLFTSFPCNGGAGRGYTTFSKCVTHYDTFIPMGL